MATTAQNCARALQVITNYATTHKLLPSQILVRLDGLYGNAAVLRDVLDTGVGIIGRSRDYALLDLAVVQAVLACPPVEVCTHPESGALRSLYDCPDVPLAAGGPSLPDTFFEGTSVGEVKASSASVIAVRSL